jgi:hypothetical protein
MTDRPRYNPNQPRLPKGHAHGGEWTRVGAQEISADSESTHDAPEPTVADLGIGAESGRGPMAVNVLPLIAAALAAIRAQGPRAAAAFALREAARNQFGNPGASLGEAPTSGGAGLPRGVAADQAVLERFAYFDALSARNNAEQVAVLEFRAGEYGRIGDLPVTRVKVLSREQVQQFCRHLPIVQEQLDEAVKDVQREYPTLRSTDPARFGSLVHAMAAIRIKALGRTDLDAEVYWLDGEPMRGLGSVGLDAQEKPPNTELFCIYDHKTGRAGLSPKRMLVLAAKAYGAGRTRIVVIETRPGF